MCRDFLRITKKIDGRGMNLSGMCDQLPPGWEATVRRALVHRTPHDAATVGLTDAEGAGKTVDF